MTVDPIACDLFYAKFDLAHEAEMVGPDFVKEWLIGEVERLGLALAEARYVINALQNREIWREKSREMMK